MKSLPDDILEWPIGALERFQERCTILEYDGGLTRSVAREAAMAEVRKTWAADRLRQDVPDMKQAADSLLDFALRVLPGRYARRYVATGTAALVWLSETGGMHILIGRSGRNGFERLYVGRVPDTLRKVVDFGGRLRLRERDDSQQPSIAELIDSARLQKGLTIAELAKRAIVDQQYIYRAKRREYVPPEALAKIAGVLGLKPEQISP